MMQVSRTLSLAVLIGLGALVANQAVGIAAVVRAKDELAAARAAQVQPLAQAARIEAQLDALASGAAKLAAAGNPNAQRVTAALRAEGVAIKAEAEPAR